MSRSAWQRVLGVILLLTFFGSTIPIVAQNEEKPANPLKKLIQGVFGQLKPGGLPKEPSGEAEENPRNRVDSRAPHDPRMADLIRIARGQMERQDWSAAAEALQRIFDEKEDSILLSDNKWVSVRSAAREMLAKAPKELLENYQAQFSALAQQELTEALAEGDMPAITSVAQRYFHTEAGYDAANWVAASYFDHGEFGLALKHYRELLSANAPITQESGWKLKFAYAARQVGEKQPGVSLEGSPATRIAGSSIRPEDWLKSLPPHVHEEQLPQENWPQFYGNSSRTGVLAGGEPLLLPRWSQPVTMSSPIQTQLNYLQEDLYDQGATPLPQAFPLMVNGKVIYRSLRGVKVVDAQSGADLWETPDPVSVEMLVTAQNGNNYGYNRFNGRVMVGFGRAFVPRYYGGGAEYHGLAHVMFRNANYGIVSSDGERLFVVEDQPVLSNRQPGQFWGGDTSEFDNFGRNWSSNRLTAYRLESGRPAWEVGGPIYNDPFSPPLAGQFFLGAPTVDGEDLFVVAERDNEIRLFCLDARTGGVHWSQLVAYSEVKIELDVARQWFVSQPSVSDGVVIVPTTVGWITAIDRRTHSVLWAQPYAARGAENTERRGPGEQMVQMTNLNDRWTAPAPIIRDGRVLFTPQEENQIVCLDLYTGNQVWQQQREDLLFLAGIHEDRVILGGRSQLKAFSLTTGKSIWSLTFQGNSQNGASNLAVPSGRGVTVGNLYYQPLASGELWSIDIGTGKVVEKAFLPPELAATPGMLGNLTMYDGMLVSLSSSGMTAFEQREAFDAEVARRLQKDAHDPIANLRVAEMESLKRHHAEALAALHRITETLPKDLAARYHRLLIENLTARISVDILQSENDLQELAAAVNTPHEIRLARRLEAQRLVALGEYRQALDAYLELAQQLSGDDTEMVSFSEKLQARPDAWLAGQLEKLWNQIPEDRRSEFDAWLEERVQTALNEDDSARQNRLRELFAFHPAVGPLEHARLTELINSRDFIHAENLLSRLRQQKGQNGTALWELAKLYESFDLRTDLAWVYGELAKLPPDTRLNEEKTVNDVLVAWRENPAPAPVSPGMSTTWHDQPVSVTRSGATYNGSPLQEISMQGTGLPFFREHRMQVSIQDQRFLLTDVASDTPVWSQPLRTRPEPAQNYVPARIIGHQVILLHHGVLHALSLVDHKVLWTYVVDDRAGSPANGMQAQRMPLPEMRDLNSHGAGFDQLYLELQSSTPLHAANERFVIFQGRRSFTVLDTDTGEVRWSLDGVLPGTLVHAGADVIYLISPDRQTVTACNPLDGSSLELPELANQFRQAICFIEGDIIRKAALNGTEQKSEMVQLQRFNPVTGNITWSIDVPSGLFNQMGNRLVVVHRSQGLRVVDVTTGRLEIQAPLPAEDFLNVNDFFAFQDFDNLYVCLNGRRSNNFYSDGMPSVMVQGALHAFDLSTGKPRWALKNEGQSLVLEQLDHNPLLVFAARKYERKGNSGFWSLGLEAVDKFSGKNLLESVSPSQAGFQNLSVNLAESYIELRSYNERVRLHPKPAAASTMP